MATKRGLGKGIDALIPSSSDNKKTDKPKEKEVIKEVIKEVPGDVMINLSDIEPNRSQPRKNFDEEKIKELAESIKQYGIVEPLVVQKKGKIYEIIAGERRWRAAKLANQKKVPVVIKDYTEQESMEIALIENVQREDLSPIEEARAYKFLIEEYNLVQEDVARKVSKDRSTITNTLRLLNLPESVQDMVTAKELSMGHARALLGLKNVEDMTKAAEIIINKKLSVREAEKLVKKLNSDKQSKKTDDNETETATYEKIRARLEEITGTKVNISRKAKGKGKIEISYFSNDDLERIISLFEEIKESQINKN